MSDVSEAVGEAVERAEEAKSKLNTAVALVVAVAATFMALCNVKDGNIVQGMAQTQAKAVDQWAYYQAKSTKQVVAESMIETLGAQRDLAPAEARPAIDARIQTYRERTARYEKEKEDIKRGAEGLEQEYDRMNVRDDQFDMAEATISISIALLGVTALTQKRWLFVVASVFALFGTALGVAGFAGLSFHPDWLAKLLT